MPHPSAGPVRLSSDDPVLLCRSCRLHRVSSGQVPYGPRSWRVDAVLVLVLAVTATAVLLPHRDAGAGLAAVVCAATAVMVLRDRVRRCPDVAALRAAPAGRTPTLASLPAGALPAQRQSRA